MDKVGLSWVPSIDRKTVVTGFLITGWLFIALIAATSFDLVPYAKVKYLFWIIPITLPAWILLKSKSTQQKISVQEEKRGNTALAVTFVSLIIAFLVSILHGNI